jgi:hypothetical protein
MFNLGDTVWLAQTESKFDSKALVDWAEENEFTKNG